MFEEAWNDQFEIEPSEPKLNEETKKKKERSGAPGGQPVEARSCARRRGVRRGSRHSARRSTARRRRSARRRRHAAARRRARRPGRQARRDRGEPRARRGERRRAAAALDAARAQSAQLARTTAGAEKERAEAEERLAAAERHATSLASVEGERAAWYAHVTAVMKKLSGLDAEWINSSTLQYTFATAGGGDVQLIVMFDAAKGTLAAAQLSPPLVAIGDLEAHAGRINSVEFLVREARAPRR